MNFCVIVGGVVCAVSFLCIPIHDIGPGRSTMSE